jgi:hypothetical protein
MAYENIMQSERAYIHVTMEIFSNILCIKLGLNYSLKILTMEI